MNNLKTIFHLFIHVDKSRLLFKTGWTLNCCNALVFIFTSLTLLYFFAALICKFINYKVLVF